MARISDFQIDGNIGVNDILVGSEFNGIGANNRAIYTTKNYRIGDIGDFLGLGTNIIDAYIGSLNSDGSFSYSSAFVSQTVSTIAGEGYAAASTVTQLSANVTNNYLTTTATNTQINSVVATETLARASAVTLLNSSISIKPNILRAASAPTITQRITAGSGQSGAITTAQNPAMGSLWIDISTTAVTAANGNVSQQPKNEFYVLQGSFGSAAWLKSQDASLLNTITSAATATSNLSTLTTADQARAAQVTELNAQFVLDGSGNITGNGSLISSAIATSKTEAVATADTARATAQNNLVATISKVFRQNDAPAVTEPINSIWYDTNDSNKSYVLVAGSPRVWTYTVDATRATSASVTQVSNTAADINGNLSASHSLMVNAGGAIAGMKVSATTNDSGVSTSNVVFLADQFTIKTSGGTKQPFTVSGDVVSIDGTLKIGSSTASSIETKANSATQASDHSTIQAGTTAANVGLGNVSNVTTDTIRQGVNKTMVGLANVVNGNFDASGNVIGGAIGGVTIAATKIFQGTGTYGNANTGFYLDNGGNFSLRDKLVFVGSGSNAGDLAIAGEITTSSGNIGGFTILANQIHTQSKATLASNLAGVYIGNDGIALGVNSPFKVTAAGALTAANATITGAITCTSISFNSGVTVPNASVAGLGDLATEDSIDATKIDDDAITTPKIRAGAIDADKIATNAITAGKINANEIDATKISSLSFSGKSAIFDSGTVGGFTLDTNKLYNGKSAIDSTTAGVFIGLTGISLGGTGTPTFSVTAAGALTAASGTIGNIVITGADLHVGTGNWSNANTSFFINRYGFFSLTDQFTYNPTLNKITINANATFAGALQAASGNFSGEITAASGTIGGWGITGSGLEAETGLVDIDSNGSITVFQGTTPRVEISSNTTVSDPLITSALSATSDGNNVSFTTLSSSNTSVFLNSLGSIDIQTPSTRNNITYFYGNASSLTTQTLEGQNAAYNISVLDASLVLTKDDVTFSGSMSYSFGIAFFTSSSNTSSPFHVSSSTAKSLTVSNSTSNTANTLSSGTVTKSGSFTWPSQETVYVRGYIKAVVVDGTTTQPSGENGTTVAVTIRPPRADVDLSDILTAIEKSEFNAGGLLVAMNSSSYFRLNRNSDTNSNQFIRSRGHWAHYGNGGFKMYNEVDAYATQFVSKFTARQTSASGYHLVFQGLVSSTNTNVALVNLNGSFQSRANSYGGMSDERLKENIIDATSKLDDIKKVKVRNFNFIGDDLKQIGVIAQELESIWPGLVEDTEQPSVTDDESESTIVKTVKYSLFGPILVKAMQEQQTLIESQKTLIDNLTARVTALED